MDARIGDIELTWKFISKCWTDKMIIDAKNESKEAYSLMEKHRNCNKSKNCRGCSIAFCDHLAGSKYVCEKFKVCFYCDDYIQPNIMNPKNRKYLEFYFKNRIQLIFPEI